MSVVIVEDAPVSLTDPSYTDQSLRFRRDPDDAIWKAGGSTVDGATFTRQGETSAALQLRGGLSDLTFTNTTINGPVIRGVLADRTTGYEYHQTGRLKNITIDGLTVDGATNPSDREDANTVEAVLFHAPGSNIYDPDGPYPESLIVENITVRNYTLLNWTNADGQPIGVALSVWYHDVYGLTLETISAPDHPITLRMDGPYSRVLRDLTISGCTVDEVALYIADAVETIDDMDVANWSTDQPIEVYRAGDTSHDLNVQQGILNQRYRHVGTLGTSDPIGDLETIIANSYVEPFGGESQEITGMDPLVQAAERNEAVAVWPFAVDGSQAVSGSDVTQGGGGDHSLPNISNPNKIVVTDSPVPRGTKAARYHADSVSGPDGVYIDFQNDTMQAQSDLWPDTAAGRRWMLGGWVQFLDSDGGRVVDVKNTTSPWNIGLIRSYSGRFRSDWKDPSTGANITWPDGDGSSFANHDQALHLWSLSIEPTADGTAAFCRQFLDGVEQRRDTTSAHIGPPPSPSFWAFGGEYGIPDSIRDTWAVHHLVNRTAEAVARDLWLAGYGRLGKPHPAIARMDTKIDDDNPGFIFAPGVPDAAGLGDPVIADQSRKRLHHGAFEFGATIADGTPLGAFTGRHLFMDGQAYQVALPPLGAFGSKASTEASVFAFLLRKLSDGALFAGDDGTAWMVVDLDSDETLRLVITDVGASNFIILTSNEPVDPAAGVVAKFDRNDLANSFVISGGAVTGVAVSFSGGAPPAIPDFTRAILGNEGVGVNNGLHSESAFIGAFAGPRASAYTVGDGMAQWQAMRGVGRDAGLLGAATLGI